MGAILVVLTGKSGYWADWAPPQSAGLAEGRSRFTTTYWDGRVRLYEFAAADLGGAASTGRKALTPVATVETASHGGRDPFSCAFHPDGRFLAVGYNDSTAVDVFSLSAPDSGSRSAAAPPQLRHAFAANTAGLDNGNLGRVAWSRDGTGRGFSRGECMTIRTGRTWSSNGKTLAGAAAGPGPARRTRSCSSPPCATVAP